MPASKKEQKEKFLKVTYGLTLAQYNQMLADQNGVCKICARPPKTMPLVVDHDHRTGRCRGRLCFNCNHRLLGKGLDQAWLHQRAADYLLSDYDGRTL